MEALSARHVGFDGSDGACGIVAETRGRMKEVFVVGVGLIAASLGGSAVGGAHAFGRAIALTAFFTAFNVMEAMLPSLVTKTAPASRQAAATGV